MVVYQDLYSTLNVPRGATEDAIRAAFKERARVLHPDRTGGDKDEFQKVVTAYEVLSDPVRRAVYDPKGHLAEASDDFVETFPTVIKIDPTSPSQTKSGSDAAHAPKAT